MSQKEVSRMLNGINSGRRGHMHRRNRAESPALAPAVILGAAAITVFIVIAVIAVRKKGEAESSFDAEQEANVNLYFTDGQEMSGGELVDAMYKLSGTSVTFAVKTLSSEGIAYYNRDADGRKVPAYEEPAHKTDPEYIRNLGVFEIHISTGGDGRRTVSATQTE